MTIIDCPNCTQKNRVPDLLPTQSARCGICKTTLVDALDVDDVDDEDEDEEDQ